MTFEIRKIGVVGAGQMGAGIAQVGASAGFDILLNDISEDRIQATIATIDEQLESPGRARDHDGGGKVGGARPDQTGSNFGDLATATS